MHLKTAAKEIKADWQSANEHLKSDERYVLNAKARLNGLRTAHAEHLAELRQKQKADEAALLVEHKAEKAVLANTQRYYAKKFVKRLLRAAGADLKAVGTFLKVYLWQWPLLLAALPFIAVAAVFVTLATFSVSSGREFFRYCVYD